MLEYSIDKHTTKVAEQKTEFNSSLYDLVLLMSDGVESFQRKNEKGILEPVPMIEVIEQILKLKGMKGEFLKRRCNKFFNKFCQQNGWQNNDDFSVAGIYLGEE
jgi:hypothetical protein